MKAFVIEPPGTVAIPVHGHDAAFPVRRVYCVGRNYAEHAREMGFSDREPPFFFCKPTDAVVAVPTGTTGRLDYPARTQDYQYEIELVVAIGRGGADIPVEAALRHVWGYAVGLDMTRRDRQIEMRQQGRPWEVGKSFDRSAIVGSLYPVTTISHPIAGSIWLSVEGEVRQRSDIGALIWNVAEIVSHLSAWFELQAGDIIFTGTPAGVGPVLAGQTMHGGIEGIGDLRIEVGSTPPG